MAATITEQNSLAKTESLSYQNLSKVRRLSAVQKTPIEVVSVVPSDVVVEVLSEVAGEFLGEVAGKVLHPLLLSSTVPLHPLILSGSYPTVPILNTLLEIL